MCPEDVRICAVAPRMVLPTLDSWGDFSVRRRWGALVCEGAALSAPRAPRLALRLDLGAPLIRWAGPQLAFGKTEARKEKGLSQIPTTYKWPGQDRSPGFSGLQDWGPLTGFRTGVVKGPTAG